MDAVVGAVYQAFVVADDDSLFDARCAHGFDDVVETVNVPIVEMRRWFVKDERRNRNSVECIFREVKR